MNVTTNADQLITQVLAGEVWPPLADRHGFRAGPDGRPFLLPGMGGVTLGVHCGDPAAGYAGDHVEPGLSVRHRDPAANYALQYLTCIGNTAVTGTGAQGFVIGQHAYVLVDMPEADMRQVTAGDQVTVFAVGQGLALADHPEITVKNCSPRLIEALAGGTGTDGRLEVHVAARVPAEAIGAGSGMASEYANADLMGAYDVSPAPLREELSLGLDGLRVGDVVAMNDQDHRFGRGYRQGWASIGVISTASCLLFGHGPGPSTIMSGPAAAFRIIDDDAANIAVLGGSQS